MFENLKKPLIIAEMSGNHNQSLKRALQIVEAAANAGVDAIKIQTYTADTMTIDKKTDEFYISNEESLWCGQSLYELYQKAYTPWEWHEVIFDRCKQLGLIAFSSPFDETAVEFLDAMHVPCYKVASFEAVDIKLIRAIAKKKKPMLISTGMATVGEIDEAVRNAYECGCPEICLLKCTSTYPAEARYSNLLTIPHMKELYHCTVGLSDHTQGIGVSLSSIGLGAMVIEKHFTLSRKDGGVDAEFSLEPSEMHQLVTESRRAYEAIGKIHYGVSGSESIEGRRSLYVVKPVKKGDLFTEDNIKAIRPGFGLPTKYYSILLGRVASQDIEAGTPVDWDLF